MHSLKQQENVMNFLIRLKKTHTISHTHNFCKKNIKQNNNNHNVTKTSTHDA